jgi:CRISPR/Cas system-associated protein Cas10 (large subunit of type III CRISPR-Cas system)
MYSQGMNALARSYRRKALRGRGSSKTVRLVDPSSFPRNTRTKNPDGEIKAPSMKTCRHCGEQKDKSEFPVHREKGSGLNSLCRTCHAEACAKWRAKHPEKVDAYNERRRAEYVAQRKGGGTFTVT